MEIAQDIWEGLQQDRKDPRKRRYNESKDDENSRQTRPSGYRHYAQKKKKSYYRKDSDRYKKDSDRKDSDKRRRTANKEIRNIRSDLRRKKPKPKDYIITTAALTI